MADFAYKTTTFLNVDLEISSRSDLQPLVTALGDRAHNLFVGRIKRTYRAHFELLRHPRNADLAIRGFATLISTLPKAERKLWDTAKTRDFNIGIQTAMRPRAYETLLSSEAITTVSMLKARIVFTIYAPDKSLGQ